MGCRGKLHIHKLRDQKLVRLSCKPNFGRRALNEPRDHSLETHLVFDGIDTFANITFCGQHVGTVNNQFRTYTFDVSQVLHHCSRSPKVKLDFTSSVSVSSAANETYQCAECLGTRYEFPGRQFIRKEQCDYGWDWGPAMIPSGIWKPARLVQIPSNTLYIKNTGVDIYRLGQVNNLPPDQNQPWVLNVTVDYLGSLPDGAKVLTEIHAVGAKAPWKGSLTQVNATGTQLTGSQILKEEPELWWPVGHGKQSLYEMTILVTSNEGHVLASATKRIGFRTIVLNQTPIAKQQIAQGIAPGANWHFEVNGKEVYSKGSNIVPLDPFWPRVTEQDVRDLFQSTIAMNQNMLRVWAGSIYFPEFIYDLADEMGLMLWTEFQFSDALSPYESELVENVAIEAAEQVRRLNSHPSTALWCGNNENGLVLLLLQAYLQHLYPKGKENFEEFYNTLLVHAVFENSRSISYIATSASSGYKSYDRSREQPFELRYATDPTAPGSYYADSDYYNYDVSQAFLQSTYPVSRFTNEFGFHSQSSYRTYAKSLPSSQLSFNSSDILLRNHQYVPSIPELIDNAANYQPSNKTVRSLKGQGTMQRAFEAYYPSPKKHSSSFPSSSALFAGKDAQFQAEIYATQLFQADFVRAQIEFYRRGSGQPQRNLGSLYWMLADTWAAPTWASVNVDGRWKMLAYAVKQSYSPVIMAPYVDDTSGNITFAVSSDEWTDLTGTAQLDWYAWNGSCIDTGLAWRRSFAVGPTNSTTLPGVLKQAALQKELPGAVGFLTLNATSSCGRTYTFERTFTPNYLSSKAQIGAMVNPKLSVKYDAATAEFIVTSHAVAGYVWLEHPDEAGKGFFSDNAFWMTPGVKKVKWTALSGGQHVRHWASKVVIGSVWDLTTP